MLALLGVWFVRVPKTTLIRQKAAIDAGLPPSPFEGAVVLKF